jgi:hypothetical protein
MHSRPAHKTPTSAEEQIGISIRKAMKSVEGIAIQRDRDARGERRILMKDVPMGMMERRHAEYSI